MCNPRSSRKFVFSIDGSEFCRMSFLEALKIVDPCYDTLHLVQVRNPPGKRNANSLFTEESWSKEIETRYNSLFKEVLDEFASKAAQANIKYKLVELFGDSKEQIRMYCSREGSCILIIGCPNSFSNSRVFLNEKEINGSGHSILLLPIKCQRPLRCLKSKK